MGSIKRQRDPSKSVSIRLCLFGGFRLDVLGRPNGVGDQIEIPAAKGRALIAYLAAGGGKRVSRETLCALLWGDTESRKARQNLRRVLHQTQRAMSALGLGILDVDKRSVGLLEGALAADIWEFEALIAVGSPAALAKAASLYAGDFFGSVDFETADFGDWLSERRGRYHDLALTALSALADRQSAARNSGAAMRTLRRILAIDPCYEPAHRQLMALFVAAGMVDVALAQYRACKAALRRDLDVAPDTATEALRREIQDFLATTRKATRVRLVDADPADDRGRTPVSQPETGPAPPTASLDPESCFAVSKSLMLSGKSAAAAAHARRALWRSMQGGRTDAFWFLGERLMFRIHLYAPRLPALCQELTGRAADFLERNDWRGGLESLTAKAMISGLAGDIEGMRHDLAESQDLIARAGHPSADVEWHQVAGFGCVWSGDGDGACEHFERALALASASGDLVRAALLRGFRARARLLDETGLETGRDLSAAINMAEELGHVPYAPLLHTWMAEFCFGQGLIDLGTSHADRAWALDRERPQAWCHAPILRAVALVCAKGDRPDLTRAAKFLDRSRALQELLGFAPRAHNRLVMPEFEDSAALRH